MTEKKPVCMPESVPDELIEQAFRVRYPDDDRGPSEQEREWFRNSYRVIRDFLSKPRKVKVTRWAVMHLPLSKNRCHSSFDTKEEACKEAGYFGGKGECAVVELTGEYEEPWDA